MEALNNWVDVGTILAVLTAIRWVLATLAASVEGGVEKSASKHDDERWRKITSNFYYQFLSEMFRIVTGAGFPQPKKPAGK